MQSLRRSGASLKALCPFHDEKTPSLNVSPGRGVWFCHGCGEGGDAIHFVMRYEQLSFAEAVALLAEQFGVTLHHDDPAQQAAWTQRGRLLEILRAAATFFADQLATGEAAPARQLLADRGFDRDTALAYGCGYAPRSWDSLATHLRGRGYTRADLDAAGLTVQRGERRYDRFRGRLTWPIADATGAIVGFGARRLHDDDDGPKYLNTPETAIYKKSHLLYGLDRARKDIARHRRVVVVEGYTDVMACHLAGEPTAVAVCGTAFGAGHRDLLRRALTDGGEVIFAFDGDSAGHKAARHAFDVMATSTSFVASAAIQPAGSDPCELRLQQGNDAVLQLITARRPLIEVVLRAIISGHELHTPDDRVAALNAARPSLDKIADAALRAEYARLLAGWLGLDIKAVAQHLPGRQRQPSPSQDHSAGNPTREPSTYDAEAELLAALLQHPGLANRLLDQLTPDMFDAERNRQVLDAIRAAAAPGAPSSVPGWVAAVRDAGRDIHHWVAELTVVPLPAADDDVDRYAESAIARLRELVLSRRVHALRTDLARTTDPQLATQLLEQLGSIEQQRRELRRTALRPR